MLGRSPVLQDAVESARRRLVRASSRGGDPAWPARFATGRRPRANGADMPKVEMDVESTVTPERVRAALLDFSARRPEIWPGIEPSLYEVYSVGVTSADIQEGSKAPGMTMWAKEHYDWSDPDLITWTVRQSNFCAPGSYVSAAISPRPGGGSRVHVTWNRTPTTIGGRIATLLILATKGMPVSASFKKALSKLEKSTAS
jgi:hypothetical protein